MVTSKQETARKLALSVLEQVFDQGAYSNIALHKVLEGCHLSVPDKALVTELVYGTVSHKITLEWYLAHFIEDREKLDSWVYYLLMLSLYQMVYLDKLPVHAVVNEAVTIAKRGRGTDKYVNAILRKISQTALPKPATIKRKNKRLSVQYSLPVWLVQTLITEYGVERAEHIFQSLQVRNKASVRVTAPEQLETLAAKLEATLSLLSPVGLVKSHGHFAGTDYFKTGLLTIQDETSQLVAPTLKVEGTEIILDACAAPGGKTCHIASQLTSGKVVALDLYDHKLSLIEENAHRLGVANKIETKRLDASRVHEVFAADTFDKILVDAPCSGIGLIRRKPDIRYNKAAIDFDSLKQIQLQILDSVCQSLKIGGIITYSTCTIIAKENQEVIQEFLRAHPNFEQVILEHPQANIMVDGCLLITPELYETDGFFIGQFRRKS
ncbi:16S rRNA (cytosine(967)-C(5))-methyltransferase RsmB [Streptococcus ruminantium]|uniref:16S rRNA (cytosine(967)-C(5))-methyltransferase RsmB n=1 Tax=Streptococcus ruminantium TaxID=1917441 RepID=UPI0012DC7AE1|nr:16S rRNA (cytosine(967)-C(5))-methyltransferase RsmB [Streptococcus ruminantium]MDQ8820747.1 16S rRNA (cytosine(967)-C(5))-methyltransferase RsmB [Streptococcus ruminantium]MDQ8836858.1 16S rRNA (cytosine(967)-C(5))-methyltransferase RsmB [Streptococcus ruminantium]